MKFVTFQPLKVKELLEKEGSYIAKENNTNFNKIFCLKVDKTTIERVFLTAPSMPQVMVIFESDEFEEIDTISWVNKLFLDLDVPSTSKYKEYMVDRIDLSSVVSMKVISTSSNADDVQDAFIDAHFEELEDISGKKWFRGIDKGESWWGSKESVEFVHAVSLCMMPYVRLDEYGYNMALSLIRKHFINEEKNIKK